MGDKKTACIRELNDSFRKTGLALLLAGFVGKNKAHMTAGVKAKGYKFLHDVIQKVRNFDAFTEDDDPYGEHDFGAFDHAGERIIWKIDYYDPDMEHGSEHPEDPDKTVRVLIIMLAREY